MAAAQTLPKTALRAWEDMAVAGLSAGFMLTFISLPVAVVVQAVYPASVGYLIVALSTQVMMSIAYNLGTNTDEATEKFEQLADEVALRHILISVLFVGSAAQALLLGSPAIIGPYAESVHPFAGVVVAFGLPVLDNELGNVRRSLSPSVWVRLAAFRTLLAVASFRDIDLKTIEDMLSVGSGRSHR